MKLIKPSWEIIEQAPGLQGVYEQIEIAGRTCYCSQHKIEYYDDSYSITAKDFVNRMIKSGHLSMLEHGTVYLKLSDGLVRGIQTADEIFYKYKKNPYSKYTYTNINGVYTGYVTTNYRVLIEQDWLDDLQYLCEPTEFHEKRVTIRFITDQGILREFTRHRKMSFAVESTRYCNYSKDQFGNEVTFVIPSYCRIEEGSITEYDKLGLNINVDFYKYKDSPEMTFLEHLLCAEESYLDLLENGWKPQEARAVLPLATKCEMVMTGFVQDWRNFFSLRALETTGKAHPDAKALAEPLMNEFKNRKLI